MGLLKTIMKQFSDNVKERNLSKNADKHRGPYPQTVAEILALQELPVVAIDHASLFTFVNAAFEQTYGWTGEELMGQPVTSIMPPHMRDGHKVGFARFMATEQATLLGTPLPLSVLYKDGRVEDSEHYIVGDKINGIWRFAAIIKPNR